MATRNADDRNTPWVAGALAGAVAYLLGYLLVYALTSATIRNSLLSQVVEVLTGDPSTWKLVGWVFYNAHFVTTEIPGLFGSNAVNFIARSDSFSPLLYLIPPLLLVGAGIVVARRGDVTLGTRDAVLTGLSVVPGYFVLAAVGTFVTAISAGNATAQPTPLTGVLLAGVVYPAVFGVVGALVAERSP